MDVVPDSKEQGIGRSVVGQHVYIDNISIIGQRLTNEDLIKLKFLCKEWIEVKNWPVIKTFDLLVARLKEEHSNDEIFRAVLIELLYTIQRYDLLKILGSCKHEVANQERNLVSRYWKEWYERVEGIEVDDAESVQKNLIPHLKSTNRPEIFNNLFEPLKDLLGEQGSILAKWRHSWEAPVIYELLYSIKTVGTYGLCIIINNKKFSDDEQVRHGTEVDKDRLVHLFESFDFCVESKDDLKKSEMETWIMEVATRNHTQFDCFVCWILSHGNDGEVQGVDTDTLKVQDIVQRFCIAAVTLTGKPKLFFINACQGNSKQGVIASPQEKESEDEMQSDSCTRTTPNICDYLISMPSIPGFAAYRSKTKGTWFATAFVEQFEDFGEKEDVMSVLTRVHCQVSAAVGTITVKTDNGSVGMPQECGQTPAANFALTKKLYLRKKRPHRQPEESE